MKIKSKTQGIEMDTNVSTIIGKDSVITGTIDVKGPLRIDGKVKGQVISTDTVTIGAGGELEAEVQCKISVVSGRVNGNIIATEKVELQAKAEISGDIKTKSLIIEQGAIFCGSCNMKNLETGLNKYADAADKARKDKDKAEVIK
ncbi:MAG: polymer-forming cytoskeletal protein [FCB group bacterium]|nr:polymer-forming cytoskeletal protein [FCB group bacterium]